MSSESEQQSPSSYVPHNNEPNIAFFLPYDLMQHYQTVTLARKCFNANVSHFPNCC